MAENEKTEKPETEKHEDGGTTTPSTDPIINPPDKGGGGQGTH